MRLGKVFKKILTEIKDKSEKEAEEEKEEKYNQEATPF